MHRPVPRGEPAAGEGRAVSGSPRGVTVHSGPPCAPARLAARDYNLCSTLHPERRMAGMVRTAAGAASTSTSEG